MEVSLSGASHEQLIRELERRGIRQSVRSGLSSTRETLRLYALLIIGVITAGLIILVGILSFGGKPIPDLVSGLTGSGVGALAGILSGQSGGGTSETPTTTPAQP